MDILSHGFFGGAAFVTKSRRSFFRAFWWGIFPDLFAFGVFFPATLLEHGFRPGPPAMSSIPAYVVSTYNFSHSLVIFLLIFCAAWLYLRRPVYEMSAWGLHIMMDIPTHTDRFFPTPFLYPLSDFSISGISWGTPWFFLSYWGLLGAIYLLQLVRLRRQKGS